jgi:hypothetical protein
MYEAILTVIVPATNDEPAHTKVYRFEFETEVAALNFFDTSDDVPGLANVEQLVGLG